MLSRTGWVGVPELSLSQARGTRGTSLLGVSFVFCKVLSSLLLQHVAVDKNAI